MSRRFVVTGASGFIGRRLCAALRERGRVTALLRSAREAGPWDDVIVADLARDDVPAHAFDGADVVYHFAGRAHTVTERAADTGQYTRVNVDGTRRVALSARAAGVKRLVFASSVKAMGEGDGNEGTRSAYGDSKKDAEDVVWKSGVADAVVLRLSLVYGPGVEGNLGAMMRAVASGRFPPPPRVDNRRSMVHVDDVVRVAIACGDDPRAAGQTFVVGDGVAYSTHSIYAAMKRALGKDSPAWALPAPIWRALARAGDASGALTHRRAPFDSEAYRKLFGSAWYEPSDLHAALGLSLRFTLDDALADGVAGR